jgi:hypothetical protein
VTIEPSETSLPHSASITLSFTAVDCDAMPMNVTHVDFDVQWDGRSVTYERKRGAEGSQYISTIPDAPIRRTPGPHTIVVALRNALNESAGPVDRCVIFARTVLLRCASGTVELFGVCERDAGSNTGQIITGGVIAALMVLGLGVLGYLLYKHREQAKKLLLSFLSFEGVLAFECACRFRSVRIPACDAGCLQHLRGGLGCCWGRIRVPAVPARIDPFAVSFETRFPHARLEPFAVAKWAVALASLS